MDKPTTDEIVKELKKRGVALPCPRCGNQHFTIVDGVFNQPLQAQMSGLVVGGPSIPSAVTVCQRCGFVAQHALGALGLLPPDEEKAP